MASSEEPYAVGQATGKPVIHRTCGQRFFFCGDTLSRCAPPADIPGDNSMAIGSIGL